MVFSGVDIRSDHITITNLFRTGFGFFVNRVYSLRILLFHIYISRAISFWKII